MAGPFPPHRAELDSIFFECRQCGTCCRKYRRILLRPSEVSFIRKMGGHVGVDIRLSDLRKRPLKEVMEEARDRGKVYMVHPDDQGCVFLEKRDGRYFCRIYHHRPQACRGFRCNLADGSMRKLFYGDDAILLLGMNRFGQPVEE